MKALVLNTIKQPLDLEERPDLHAAPGEVVVLIMAAALNRRDYWITQGMYPGIKTPIILGSDGAGVVSKIGAGVDTKWLGSEVIINPGLNWGGGQAAQEVTRSTSSACPTTAPSPPKFRFPPPRSIRKPEHLSWITAAALPLAGVTAYRALFSQGQLRSGDTVVITGIGGGVATFALQFAVAAGADVWVTSSSRCKNSACYRTRGQRWIRLQLLRPGGGMRRPSGGTRSHHRWRRRRRLQRAARPRRPGRTDRQLRLNCRPTFQTRSLQSVLETTAPRRNHDGLPI